MPQVKIGAEDFFTILQEVINCGSDDVPRLVKKVEQLVSKCKGVKTDITNLDGVEIQSISQQGSKAYFSSLSSAKLSRLVYKLLKCLPKPCNDVLQKDVTQALENLVKSHDAADVRKLSILLDQNHDAKVYAKTAFYELSVQLGRLLSVCNTRMIEDPEYLHVVTKLCIQVQQLCSDNMEQIFASDSSSPLHMDKDILPIWQDIVHSLLVNLIECERKEDILLLGTAIAMTFNSVSSPTTTVQAYQGIISLLNHETCNFEFCGMHFRADTILQSEFFQKDNTVAMIAIFKGLLVSCNKNTLSFGSCPFIFIMFSHILKFCLGPTKDHYLAFQNLAVWVQKMQELVALRPGLECLIWLQSQTGRAPSSKQSLVGKNESLNASCTLNCKNNSDILQPSDLFRTDDQKDNNINNSIADDTWGTSKHVCASMLRYMSTTCPVLIPTLNTVWLNWESPVDGVQGFLFDILQRLLSIWSVCVQDGTSDYSHLCKDLFGRLLVMAWHCKTRYRPMRLLLPFISCEQVLGEYPSLKDELLECMKTNILAPIASETYKAFLEQISLKSESGEPISLMWQKEWMSTLVSGLTSRHELQRLKIATYWIEPTLALIPGSVEVLLSHLEQCLENYMKIIDGNGHNSGYASSTDKCLHLYAWTAILRVARDKFHAYVSLRNEALLRMALSSENELVRAEAFFVISSTIKKAEPMSTAEINLLQEFLPPNLKTDCAPLRHSLVSSMRKVLARLRDSCLSSLRTSSTAHTFLDESIAFVDWFYKLLMSSLSPGTAYQRRQTCFDLLTATLQALMYQQDDMSRKGKPSESADTLVKFAQGRGQWNFFSKDNFLTLLVCLEDGAEEIQTHSFTLLTTFYKWPCSIQDLEVPAQAGCTNKPAIDTLPLLHDVSFVREMMDRAFYLVSQPRAYENHSGLLLFSLVLNKYIIGCGLRLETVLPQHMIDIDPEIVSLSTTQHGLKPTAEAVASNLSSESSTSNPSISPHGCDMLELLIGKVRQSLQAVQSNIAANIRLHPIHGLLQCISRCLQDMHKSYVYKSIQEKGLADELNNVTNLNQKLVDFVLEVLAGGKPIADCPSFADIGSAIESLVSGDEESEETTTTLSPEFQLLLSWCWINLKESCSCLAAVVATSLQHNGESELSYSTVYSIGETFVKVLTTCRHRGAIEGCRGGLHQFSVSLMGGKSSDLANIPVKILNNVLGSLSENTLTSSVTRRSAGLPIIVQTILQAACKSGKVSLLVSTVGELYTFAIEPLPPSHSQQHDLRQSHALNILKTIFCDASLAPRLMPLVSKMVVLVIQGFDSPSWTIRNAATQLISTLVTRIFGQRNKTGSAGSLSLEEFNSLYPEIVDFIVNKLNTYLASSQSSTLALVRPSLYVILTLLANLGPVPANQQSTSCRGTLMRAAESFLSSPVYSLRKLAAQVWVALSALDQSDSSIDLALQHIQQNRGDHLNTLHGWLFCAFDIVSLGQLSKLAVLCVFDFLLQNKWLLLGYRSCLMIPSSVVSLIHQVLACVKDLKDMHCHVQCSETWILIKDCLFTVCCAEETIQIAKEQFVRECVLCLLVLEHMLKQAAVQVVESGRSIVTKGLDSHCVVLQLAVLDSIQESFVKDSLVSEDCQIIKAGLWNYLQKLGPSSGTEVIIKSSEILLKLVTFEDLEGQHNRIHILENILALLLKRVPVFHKTILCLQGRLMEMSTDERLISKLPEIQVLCEQVVNLSDSTTNEDLRLSAAIFIRNCGPRLICFCCENRHSHAKCDTIVTSIIKTGATLLDDTELSVRNEVSIFVSRLVNTHQMHYAVAFGKLTGVIGDKLYWSSGLCSYLLETLYKEGTLSAEVQQALSTVRQALFEPEAKSALSETSISQLWAFYALQKIVHVNGEPCLALLHRTCSAAGEELQSVLPVIKYNLIDKRMFNLSSEESVFAPLLGITLLNCLCHNISILDPSTSAENFQTAVSQLQQIENLHSHLFKSRTIDESDPRHISICSLLNS